LYNIAGTGVGEAALLSAIIGGGSAAISGGDPLKGALLGALTGGVGNLAAPALGSLFGATAPGITEGLKLGAEFVPEAIPGIADAATTGINMAPNVANTLGTGVGSAGSNLYTAGFPQVPGTTPFSFQDASLAAQKQAAASSFGPFTHADLAMQGTNVADPTNFGLNASEYFKPALGTDPANPLIGRYPEAVTPRLPAISNPIAPDRLSLFDEPMAYLKANKPAALAAGIAGITGSRKTFDPPKNKYTGALSQFNFDPSKYMPSHYAGGGITSLDSGGYDRQVGDNPMYMPAMASGGIATLGGYSDGGRMLKGPGDGMSDSIPASIAGKQPARLARDEFVVPADVVSHLGNGSSDAGAKQLYAMMDRIRQARTGTKKQGREIRPSKFMPA
jgi:hypothetical protein